MKIRKITSLVAALAFVVMVLTSFVLYIVPQGRIAYWTGWKLLGLSKTQWGDIHINTGILFLLALVLHTYYNWRSIVHYLSSASKQLTVFTREFNAALLLVGVCVAGTLMGIQPFSGILDINAGIKDRAALKYGEPPYGHAELSSLKLFTQKNGLSLEKSMLELKAAGYTVTGEKETLASIGQSNKISPQKIFETIRDAKQTNIDKTIKTGGLPDSTPGGFGRMTLKQFCNRFELNLDTTLSRLEKANIRAAGDQTIKQIASENNTIPMEVYEIIKSI